MKIVYIKERDKTGNFEVVACMPLCVWRLTVWLCNRRSRIGILGGHIYDSYKHANPPHWGKFKPLFDGVKIWWRCNPWKQ